ncbi:unnamed protein product [Peniophora sp. CBMAI 1063]|nr:unnamed protein product [Peniophora sp. CBMAI 1063]
MSGLLYIEEQCIVCTEDFGINRKANSIACGHVYCRECLNNIDPPVCPVCREEFDDEGIECIGPWEEESNPAAEPARVADHNDDWEWDPDVLDHLHEEGRIWEPSDADREDDLQARDELGLPRDQDEERYDRARSALYGDVGRFVEDENGRTVWERGPPERDDSKPDWALLDSEYAEDRAAWEALGLRA